MIIFSTDRLSMTPLTTEHLASTHAYATDPANTRYMLFMPKASLEETKKYLLMAERQWQDKNGRCFEFAVLLKAKAESARAAEATGVAESAEAAEVSGSAEAAGTASSEEVSGLADTASSAEAGGHYVHIGSLSAFLSEDRTSAELGWILAKDYWGKGYALEAVSALIRWCQKTLGVRRLTAHCDEENTASRRLMEKLGFVLADTSGSRKNRLSQAESREYEYHLQLLPPDPQPESSPDPDPQCDR